MSYSPSAAFQHKAARRQCVIGCFPWDLVDPAVYFFMLSESNHVFCRLLAFHLPKFFNSEYHKTNTESTVISYPLLNKDLIQFAHRSSKVRKMLIDGERVEAIRLYITGTKFRNITGDPELTDVQVLIITELLDEMSPKGVFKEFNSEIRKSLKAAK